MRIIPAPALIALFFLPLGLALIASAAPATERWVWLADALIFLVAAVDLFLLNRDAVHVGRAIPEVLSLARPVEVQLELQNKSRRKIEVHVQEALFSGARAEQIEEEPEAGEVPTEPRPLPLKLKLDPGAVHRARYRLTAMQRGTHTLGDHFIRYRSGLGLFIRQLRLPAKDVLRVYPDVQAVRQYDLLARTDRRLAGARLMRLRGGDTEFERLRDFSPDDEWRRIDWRATARRSKLTVREYQLEQNQNLVFMLDCGRFMTAVWGGLTALDHALNATLMLSHVALRAGDRVGLLAFEEQTVRLLKPTGGHAASNRLIRATYDLFPRLVEPDYAAAFAKLRMHVKSRTLVVFITHAVDAPAAARIQRHARELLPRHLPLVVLLRDAELEARANTPGDSDRERCEQAAAAELLEWRHRQTEELRRAGVLVLDVLAEELTGALVSRYLEVKARGLI